MTPNEGLYLQEVRDLIQARNEEFNEIGGHPFCTFTFRTTKTGATNVFKLLY
jgi:hypothetical protein